MFLVADCGATKCDWAISDGNECVKTFTGAGFNPVHSKDDSIFAAIKNAVTTNEVNAKSIDNIFFYCAGCIDEISSDKVKGALRYFFPDSKIETFDDLTAAGRAIFKTDSGIACILGTGCNAGVYTDMKIQDHIPPLGYILGDEGSGTSIGKRLINAIYKKELPDEYREMFERECMLNYDDVIYGVYKSDTPAVFLSSFMPFIHDHINDLNLRNLVLTEFDQFFNRNIIRLDRPKSYTAGFVGSVAVHFADILKDAARFHGITISTIVQKPIQRLVEFHNEVPQQKNAE